MFQCVQIISKCGQVCDLQRNQIDVGGHRAGDLLGCVSIFIDVAKDFIAVHQDLRCYDVGFIFRFGFHVVEHELMNRGGFRHIPVKLVMPYFMCAYDVQHIFIQTVIMKFSKLAREIYGHYTDQIEPYGMDECWLDVTGSGCMGTGFEIADEIRRTVKFEVGLTISTGVSFNKIFAKLGSDMKKPDAITCIEADSFREKIWCHPASDLLGVGRATEKVLSSYGIHTIGELAATSDDFLKCRLGKNGLVIKKYANGLDDSPVMRSDYVSPVKSIGHGITTMQDLDNNAEVWCVMLELVQEIGTKLRTHKKKAGGMAISIRNNELYTKEWQCRISIPTQSLTYLAKTAFALFAKNYQWEHPIRSVTVRAINLFEEDCPIQYDLFTDMKSLDRQERLDAAIEQIRLRFGKDAIKNGVLFQRSKMPTERKVDLVMPTGMIG